MSRGLSSTLITALQSDHQYAHLFEFQFSTPLYHTDSNMDIVYGGNTYQADGNVLSFSPITESINITVETVTVTMSGAAQANIATALLESYIDKRVIIRLATLNSVGAIIAAPIILLDGNIDSFSVREAPGDTSELKWQVKNHWADFMKVNGQRTNDADHQSINPGDKGFDHASEIIRDAVWGKI